MSTEGDETPESTLSLRLPTWTNCVLEVLDIGKLTVWGRLVDMKENLVVDPLAIFPIDEEWQIVQSAEDLIGQTHPKK